MTKQIEALLADELIATDEGTHAYPEALKIFERIDGTRYGVRTINGVSSLCSADAESTHGRVRPLASLSPAERRKQIEHLRAVEIEQAKSAEKIASRRAELARGWDGYRFVGVDEGRKIAAAL